MTSPYASTLRHLAPALVAPIVVMVSACSEPETPSRNATSEQGFIAQRPEFEELARVLVDGTNDLLGRGLIPRMKLALKNPELRGQDRFRVESSLAARLVREGFFAESFTLYERLLAEAKLGTKRAQNLTRDLGIAYLREAENLNCVARHVPDCCIFPIQGGGVHTDRDPARAAYYQFLEYLDARPGHLRTRWLLNVAAMALGEYPALLPEEHLIPIEAFASDMDIGHFPDVAPKLGIDRLNLCGGVGVEDFDGDGLLDILTSTYDPNGPLALYRSQGDGTFVDVSDEARTSDQLGGLNMITADYDNDGDADVLILRGAWLGPDGRMRNSLLRNDGGSFVDVTRTAGLADPQRPTQSASFGDLDNDGDLDLVVVNESAESLDQSLHFPTQLFRNNGDGTFTDIAAEAGVGNDRFAKGVTLGDYDNDGDLDIYVSNFGPNRLYRNDGQLRFTDVAPSLGVIEPAERSFATWFFDYDNDGWLDIFVTEYVGSATELVSEALGLKQDRPRPRLYHNLGGTFEEVGKKAGLDRFFLPMGANFGDLDSDGWLDMYLTTGDPSLESIFPNAMLRNDGGEGFQDVTTSGGFGHLQKGHGVAFADLDNDGDQDVYHQLGGFYPVDAFHNALFLNPGHGHHFVTLELEGTASNRDAVGARIAVFVTTPSGTREIHRAVGSVSSFGGSPRRQEIGLGDATSIDRIEIHWPRTGELSVYTDVTIDSFFGVVEGDPDLKRMNPKRLTF